MNLLYMSRLGSMLGWKKSLGLMEATGEGYGVSATLNQRKQTDRT
jgi:hypothetical protein